MIDCRCDKCGKQIDVDDEHNRLKWTSSGIFESEFQDMRTFDICSKCFTEFIVWVSVLDPVNTD